MASIAFDINHPGISVYQALTSKELNEEEKAKIVAEAIDTISKEFPNLKYVVTTQELKNSELKLTKEIEATRKEIKELEVKLTKEIEATRKEIKELDIKLTKEIKELDIKLTKEIKELDIKLTREIKDTKFSMLKWQFLFWLSQIGAIIAILYKLLPMKG